MSLSFSTIPKACGFEAATHFTYFLMCGSFISIVVIEMGMALTNNKISKFTENPQKI